MIGKVKSGRKDPILMPVSAGKVHLISRRDLRKVSAGDYVTYTVERDEPRFCVCKIESIFPADLKGLVGTIFSSLLRDEEISYQSLVRAAMGLVKGEGLRAQVNARKLLNRISGLIPEIKYSALEERKERSERRAKARLARRAEGLEGDLSLMVFFVESRYGMTSTKVREYTPDRKYYIQTFFQASPRLKETLLSAKNKWIEGPQLLAAMEENRRKRQALATTPMNQLEWRRGKKKGTIDVRYNDIWFTEITHEIPPIPPAQPIDESWRKVNSWERSEGLGTASFWSQWQNPATGELITRKDGEGWGRDADDFSGFCPQ